MELNAARNVAPISDFRKQAAAILRRLRKTKEPFLLTQNGRSVAVLMDVQEYEDREYDRRFARAIAAGRTDVAKGRTHPHRKVMREMQEWLQAP